MSKGAFTWEAIPDKTERTILDWIGEKFKGEWAPMDNVTYQAIKAVATDGSGRWAILLFVEDDTTMFVRYAYEMTTPHPHAEDIEVGNG